MKCYEPGCEGDVVNSSVEDFAYDMLGFPVVVRRLTLPVCRTCHACLLDGATENMLARPAYNALLRRAGLTPTEVVALRKALGLTQSELAKLMRVQRLAVVRWEGGSRPCTGPSEVLLKHLVNSQLGLGIKPAELSTEEGSIPGEAVRIAIEEPLAERSARASRPSDRFFSLPSRHTGRVALARA
jgi:transcriptional regulator with XRE-family HTH domain